MPRPSLWRITAVYALIAACGLLIWRVSHGVPDGKGTGDRADSSPPESPDKSTQPATGQAGDVDLKGTYSCSGENPGERHYSGTVSITRKNDTYELLWTISKSQTHRGVGVCEGNVLSVCFVTNDGPGVVSYRIERDEDSIQLVGRWTSFGMGETLTERLIKRTRAEEISESI